MDEITQSIREFSLPARILVFLGVALITHLIVVVIRSLTSMMITSHKTRRYRKLRSVGTLATSTIVFTLYFLATGLILRELGVSLTAYLASASVVGLAIGFGSQGVVQDVVSSLTFIFSDLIDVGDLVEISGKVGIVKAITMRFVELEDAMGASVFIPNRTISNIVSYPRGYVRCIVDLTLRGEDEVKTKMHEVADTLMHSYHEQFAGILIREPSNEGRITLQTGKEFLRLKFRIWPNRGGPIESYFLQELTAEMKKLDPDYQAWMINVSYEVERKVVETKQMWAWRTT
ncbi:putative MscS family protein YkuT [Thalassocella blandensis]|nr:putative MscS family protein YkuT [Thalassocella blandensis]